MAQALLPVRFCLSYPDRTWQLHANVPVVRPLTRISHSKSEIPKFEIPHLPQQSYRLPWCTIIPQVFSADSREGRFQPMILQGFLRILSFFDVAEAIEMEKLRVILGPEAVPRSPAFTHRSPEYAQTQQHAPIVESVARSPSPPAKNSKVESNITGSAS